MGTAILLLIAAPVFFLLLRFVLIKSKVQVSPAFNKVLFALFLLAIGLFISAIILARYNIYFKGYRSTSFIFLAMSVSGGLFYSFCHRHGNIVVGKILSLATAICLSLSGPLAYELAYDYAPQLVYNDARYRLEETHRGVNEPCGLPKLFIKSGIFEKRYDLEETGYGCISGKEIKSVSIADQPRDSVTVTIYHTVDTSWRLPNPLVRTISHE
jgi:hypothetical protein